MSLTDATEVFVIARTCARAAGAWAVVSPLLMSGAHSPRRPRLSLTTETAKRA